MSDYFYNGKSFFSKTQYENEVLRTNGMPIVDALDDHELHIREHHGVPGRYSLDHIWEHQQALVNVSRASKKYAKCECGSEKLGYTSHSSWCPKN